MLGTILLKSPPYNHPGPTLGSTAFAGNAQARINTYGTQRKASVCCALFEKDIPFSHMLVECD